MKNIFKVSIMVLSLLLLVGCNDDDTNARFSNDPSLGWIQFTDDSFAGPSPTFETSADVPVAINAPLNETDLTINYSLVAVSGLDVNSVYSQNALVVPAGLGGTAVVGGGFQTIEFDLLNLPALTEPMVFDIVLQSTDRSSIGVGIAGTDRPTTTRVTICPQYSAEEMNGLFLGDFTIESVENNSDAVGLGITFGGSVTITQGTNGPLSRTFTSNYAPNTVAIPYTFTFDITEDGFVNTSPDLDTALNCVADDQPDFGIGFGASDVVTALTCGDSEFTLNALEFKLLTGDPDDLDDLIDLGGLGGCFDSAGDLDQPLTLVLTKS